MALSPGEQALYDRAIASGQSTVSSTFVPSASLAKVNAALASGSAGSPSSTITGGGSSSDTIGGGGNTASITGGGSSTVIGGSTGGSRDTISTGSGSSGSSNIGQNISSGVSNQVGQQALTTISGQGGGSRDTIPLGNQQQQQQQVFVDPNAVKSALDTTYQYALGRTIGDEGSQFWVNEVQKAVQSGTPLDQAIANAQAAITSSGEASTYKQTGTARTDVAGSQAVDKTQLTQQLSAELPNVYTDVLGPGRQLGEEGLQYFTTDYNNYRAMGLSHEKAMDNIRKSVAGSAEAQSVNTVRDWFNVNPNATDADIAQAMVDFGVGSELIAQVTGVPLDEVKQRFIGANVDLTDYNKDLTNLYTNLLDRPPRDTGYEYFATDYKNYRSQGYTHEQAMGFIEQSIQDSPERAEYVLQQERLAELAKLEAERQAYLKSVINSYYTRFLGRELGTEGYAYWGTELQRLMDQGYNESDAFAMIAQMIQDSEEAKIYSQSGVARDGIDSIMPDMGAGTVGLIQDQLVQRAVAPAVPVGGAMQPAQIGEATPEQIIGAGAGQVGTMPGITAATAETTAQAAMPGQMQAVTAGAATVTPSINEALQTVAPAQGSVSQQAQVDAAQMSPTATQVGTVGAAQITEAQQVQAPQSRTLQEGELVAGVANAQQAAAFAEQVGAATADPTSKATVQGQLADLMTQFEDGQTPAWAAGAMRQATATLAARGLGASSIAGQAIVQAAMEASLPIAAQDAQTVAQFELTNLSNRQARAMLAAQQRATFIGQEFDQAFQARVANAARIADVANINFNAEQQIALENAQLAQTVDIANLNSRQALVMAEASQIANLETANLNNRQQAAVQNAQAFLQMDLTNLSNQQQTDMFKAQSSVQALLSDQAAENAARQFNASSENQTNQFFTNLQSQISQYNATQSNAMAQFNAEQSNVASRFNAELQNQRDQFNATNQLVIEQSNAQWRREISTADTAAQNLANQFNAQAILEISNTAYAQLWQAYRDDMEFAWQSGENERDRITEVAIQRMKADATKYSSDAAEDGALAGAVGTFAAAVVSKWG